MSEKTEVINDNKQNHQTLIFTAILAAASLIAVCLHFFPKSEIAYVICPWLYMPCFLYVSRSITKRHQAVIWLFFWVGSFTLRYWGFLSAYSEAASVIMEVMASLVYMIPFIADRIVYNKRPFVLSLFVFAFASASVDYMFELTNIGSLFSMAATQFDNKPLIQAAAFVGSKGVVFLMTLSASLLVHYRRKTKKFVFVLAGIALLHLCGFIRIQINTSRIEKSEKVNAGWSGEPVTDDSFFSDSEDGSSDYALQCLEKAAKEAQEKGLSLLCFPEESFYLVSDQHSTFVEGAQALAKEYGMNLLLPIESDDPDDDESMAINHAVFISSDGELLYDYIKSILVPVAEEPYYVEGEDVLPDISVTLGDKDMHVSYAICFDGDSSSYIRTMPGHTNLFIDVSWDWDAVEDLHYRIIGLRAVENGVTVLKPTIGGYTTVTDYLGIVHSKTHSSETGYSGVNVVELPTATVGTIYQMFGHIIDVSFLVGFAVLLLLSLVLRSEKMEKTESKKPLTRFGEFEFLKAMAIVGLPLVHVMEEAVEANMASATLSSFGNGILGLCAFGPSVFMICMGFGIGGGKTSADSIRRNGIQFLLIGAILNVFRWFIPGVIQKFVVGTDLLDDVNFCLQSDIYYFVGIFFIFYSFMKKYKVTTPQLLLTSIIMLTANNALTPVMQKFVTNKIAASLIGNIIYVDGTSCFPLLSWAIFPTVGIILGEILKKRDDAFREVFMRRMMDFSIVFLGAFTFFLWKYKVNLLKVFVSPANEYITDLPNVIVLLALACFLIGIVYYLCKAIGHTGFMAFVLKISTFIIPFYLLQWVLIAWVFYGTTIFGVSEGSFGILAYVITVAIVTALCIYVSTAHGMKIMKVIMKVTTIKKKRKKVVKKVEK